MDNPPLLYEPLDKSLFEIHLLLLNLHDGSDKLVQCWLHTVSLQDRPSYTAVSYAWGDPGATAPIICNGIVTRVTKSLDSALRCIRARYSNSELETVVLWVDGLCINQQDISERANQVRIMDLIYQNAFSTIVWLGEEDENSSYAMDMIQQIGSGIVDASSPETWSNIPDLFESRLWKSLDKLFCRQFWSRLWVLQEIALSSQVLLLCGDKDITWDTLAEADRFWQTIEWGDPWKHLSLDVVRLIKANHYTMLDPFIRAKNDVTSANRIPILLNLYRTLHLRCSDPRDKIYALLGISDNGDDKINPDYSKPVHEVYTDLLSTKLHDGDNIAILLLSGSGVFEPRRRTMELPSWVCDWNAWCADLLHHPTYFLQRLCCNAAGDSESTVRTSPGSDMLRTKAIFCETISRLESATSQWSYSFWDRFLVWDTNVDKYPTGIPRLQAMLRVMLADNDRESMERFGAKPDMFHKLIAGFSLVLDTLVQDQPEDDFAPYLAFERWKAAFEFGQIEALRRCDQLLFEDYLQHRAPRLLDVRESMANHECYDLYCDRSSFNTENCCFFETARGYMGLGPKFTQIDDEVCVLPGLSVPLVMRHHVDYYEMVGPCFILGFMDGEAIDLLKAGKASLQDITVR